jgi:hypothetical protein
VEDVQIRLLALRAAEEEAAVEEYFAHPWIGHQIPPLMVDQPLLR